MTKNLKRNERNNLLKEITTKLNMRGIVSLKYFRYIFIFAEKIYVYVENKRTATDQQRRGFSCCLFVFTWWTVVDTESSKRNMK